jgi:hypothetical protein
MVLLLPLLLRLLLRFFCVPLLPLLLLQIGFPLLRRIGLRHALRGTSASKGSGRGGERQTNSNQQDTSHDLRHASPLHNLWREFTTELLTVFEPLSFICFRGQASWIGHRPKRSDLPEGGFLWIRTDLILA